WRWRRRRRWRWRRRRHIDAHSRVIANPELHVVVVADDVFVILAERGEPPLRRYVPADARAEEPTLLRLGGGAPRRAGDVLGVVKKGRPAAIDPHQRDRRGRRVL